MKTYYYAGPVEPVRLVRPKLDHFFSAWLGNGRLSYLSNGKDRQIITRMLDKQCNR